jgi:hypothetical protein
MFRRFGALHGDVNETVFKVDRILNVLEALKDRIGELIFLVSLSTHLSPVTVNKFSMFENIGNVTISGGQYNIGNVTVSEGQYSLTGELPPISASNKK